MSKVKNPIGLFQKNHVVHFSFVDVKIDDFLSGEPSPKFLLLLQLLLLKPKKDIALCTLKNIVYENFLSNNKRIRYFSQKYFSSFRHSMKLEKLTNFTNETKIFFMKTKKKSLFFLVFIFSSDGASIFLSLINLMEATALG